MKRLVIMGAVLGTILVGVSTSTSDLRAQQNQNSCPLQYSLGQAMKIGDLFPVSGQGPIASGNGKVIVFWSGGEDRNPAEGRPYNTPTAFTIVNRRTGQTETVQLPEGRKGGVLGIMAERGDRVVVGDYIGRGYVYTIATKTWSQEIERPTDSWGGALTYSPNPSADYYHPGGVRQHPVMPWDELRVVNHAENANTASHPWLAVNGKRIGQIDGSGLEQAYGIGIIGTSLSEGFTGYSILFSVTAYPDNCSGSCRPSVYVRNITTSCAAEGDDDGGDTDEGTGGDDHGSAPQDQMCISMEEYLRLQQLFADMHFDLPEFSAPSCSMTGGGTGGTGGGTGGGETGGTHPNCTTTLCQQAYACAQQYLGVSGPPIEQITNTGTETSSDMIFTAGETVYQCAFDAPDAVSCSWGNDYGSGFCAGNAGDESGGGDGGSGDQGDTGGNEGDNGGSGIPPAPGGMGGMRGAAGSNENEGGTAEETAGDDYWNEYGSEAQDSADTGTDDSGDDTGDDADGGWMPWRLDWDDVVEFFRGRDAE